MFFDGAAHDLVAGHDFHIPIDSMRIRALNQARRRGLRIRTSIRGDVLTVLALQPAAESEATP